MNKRDCIKGLLASFVLCILIMTGCGDDVNVSIPLITVEQLESDETKQKVSEESPHQTLDETQHGQKEDAEGLVGGTEPEEISITISAAGDVTLGNYKDQEYSYSFRQTYEQTEDKNYFFANVADIFKADDFTIVNLEGALTLSEEYAEGRTYNIKGDPEYAFMLRDASVEAVSMANNHRLDYGEDGSKDTVAALEAADILYAYDRNLGICEVEGIRIGWVSVNEVSQGKNVEKYLEEGIKQLKKNGADLILACCHWGIERDNYPEEYQKELGRKCIDWGADLVIGHHPHVLQGIDQYQGKYIVYSLGNFCFGANRNPSDKDTMIFQQTFTFREEPVEADAEGVSYRLVQPGEARIIPCSVSSVTNRNNYQPTPLGGENWQRVIGRINEYSQEFSVGADGEGVLSCQNVVS
ncbi:MAG: CapA family protein [Lachnospiraceae bacterium]|nr:CapA family protein [Lachnospiraceae bacterium]